MRVNNRLRVLGVTTALLLSSLTFAQSDDSDDTGIDTTLKPRAAEIAPRAPHTLLLDITRAGKDWVVVGSHGIVLRSSDGQHWTQSPSPADETLTRVRFTDAQHGWVLGYDGLLMHSDDGGAHWQIKLFNPKWGKPWYDLHFSDAEHGWLVGANGAMKKTDDGGQTWTDVDASVLQDQPNLYNLVQLGDGTLMLAGERGFMARSTDAGASWVQLRSPYTGSYFGALPIGARGVLIFGLRGNTFYAADVDAVPVLTEEQAEAIRNAALDASTASQAADPISTVDGWKQIANDSHESLYGGSITADGRVLLFGGNGRIVQVDSDAGTLRTLPLNSGANFNTGVADGDDLITVGTDGVQRLAVK